VSITRHLTFQKAKSLPQQQTRHSQTRSDLFGFETKLLNTDYRLIMLSTTESRIF